MSAKLICDLLLLMAIISSGILFIVVNIRYVPEDRKDDDTL